MEALLYYLVKMLACSAVMFAYYLLFLRDKTFHHYNRFYLLITVLSSLLLPLLKVEYFTVETDSRLLLLLDAWNRPASLPVQPSLTPETVLGIGLALVSVVLLARTAMGLFRIRQLERTYPKEELEGISFYRTNLEEAPFSFFRNLFWKNSILLHSDLGKQILKHEMVHIEQKHSLDKLLMQLVQSVFWFNPVFYYIKKELHLIHEYLADKKSLQNKDTKAFAQMLLASKFSGELLPATNPFLSSNLKKRLQMLTKQNPRFSYARRILALPILFIVSFALLVNAKNKQIKVQNREIAKAVQAVKKDTLKAKDIQNVIKSHQEKINKASEKIKKDNEKIKLLSEETRKKAEELQKIAQEKGDKSYEFELKTKELDQLGREIEKIAQSEHFRKNLKDIEVYTGDIEKYFNSDDFKKHFKDLEGKVMKFEKANPSRLYMEVPTPKVPFPPMSPMEVRTLDKEALSKLTAEQQKALKKIQKEREEVAKKQAEVARRQAEIMKKEAEILGEKMKYYRSTVVEDAPGTKRVIIRGKAPKVFRFDSDGNSVISDDTKIYINGKLTTKEEMDKLNPNDITTVNVNKTNNNGEENNEIRIQTK